MKFMLIATFEDLKLELEKNSGTLFLAPLTEQLYRSHDALSQSELKVVADKSPMHLRYQRRHPRPQTDPMRLGTAAHKAILEPSKFEECYLRVPKVNRSTKEGKAIWNAALAEAEELQKEILNEEDYETALLMRESIFSNKEIASLLEGGVAERSCIGRAYGVSAKALLDYYRPSSHEIVDLKSTRCASLRQFERDIRSYRYHWQDCWYSDLVKEITGEAPTFKIVAVENVEPYCAAVFSIKFDLRAIARREIQQTVDLIKRCQDTGVWPGYPSEVNELGAWKREWDAYKKALQEGA